MMDQLLLLLGIISLLLFLAGMRMLLKYLLHRRRLHRYLQSLQDTKRTVRESDKPAKGIAERVAVKLFAWASHFGRLGSQIPFPHTLDELQLLLDRSGVALRLTTVDFLGLKIMFAIFGFIVGCIAFLIRLPFSQFGLVLLPIAGFIVPVIWLHQAVRRRQDSISRDLPDFLDLISVTLREGVSLDYALQQTASIFAGPLHEEIVRLDREMGLGVERETAWKRLLERNSAPNLQKLANAVLQGNILGVPIAEVFKLQADDSRRLQIEKVKQRAAKASPKITLVTTVIMAPAVFVMILGLLLLNVFYNPEGLGVHELFK